MSPKRNHKCNLCIEEFKTLNELSLHVEKNHVAVLKRTFNKCFICNENCSNFDKMVTHMKVTHDIEFRPVDRQSNEPLEKLQIERHAKEHAPKINPEKFTQNYKCLKYRCFLFNFILVRSWC